MPPRQIILLGLVLIVCLAGCGRSTSESTVTLRATATSVPPTATPDVPKPEGHLIILDTSDYPNHGIDRINVATGESQRLFSAPEFSWIYQLQVQADEQRVIFAYSPPPGDGRGLFDRSAVYALSLTDSSLEPEAVLGGNLPNEFYYEPTVSPDGRFMYYVRYAVDATSVIGAYQVLLERYDLALRERTTITADGIWPQVSPDGENLIFIGVDPQTLQRGLYLTDLNGSQFQELIPLGRFFDIDVPHFSPDEKWIYVSVAEEPPQSSLLDWLLGVKPAYAHADHNVPSDWWRISLLDGILEKITNEQLIILSGDFSPDGQFLAFSTTTGLYIMQADGTNVTRLKEGQTFGTLRWVE
ncbi:MAG: hypothetical protein AAF629_02570 [Chloroflexota bacterium]